MVDSPWAPKNKASQIHANPPNIVSQMLLHPGATKAGAASLAFKPRKHEQMECGLLVQILTGTSFAHV